MSRIATSPASIPVCSISLSMSDCADALLSQRNTKAATTPHCLKTLIIHFLFLLTLHTLAPMNLGALAV
jgi:hypothetical protein